MYVYVPEFCMYLLAESPEGSKLIPQDQMTPLEALYARGTSG